MPYIIFIFALMSPVQISVVIVNYNVRDFLTAAIRSVKKHVAPPYEIIVVDNASTDDSVAYLKEHFKDVKLIANQHNAGFSKANNQAFEIAQGKYILMLNPDAELVDDHVFSAIDLLQKHSGNNLVGPRLLNPDGSLQTSAWKFQNVFHHLLEALFLNKLIKPFDYTLKAFERPEKVDSLSGACILFSRETMEALSGLDNDLFWMDDVDFCYRCMKAGGSNFYMSSWEVKHFIGSSSGKNLKKVISNQLISKLKFYKKHEQWVNFIFTIPVFLIHILLRLILLAPLALFHSSSAKKWSAYFYTLQVLLKYIFTGAHPVT